MTSSLNIPEIARKNPQLKALLNEDIIDLSDVPVPIDEGETEILDCTNFLELNKSNIDFLVCQIPYPEFDKLFQEATDTRKGSEHYITALKIYFGIDAKKPQCITPVFQPLYMKKVTLDEAYQANECNEYVFSENTFKPVSTQEATELKERYAGTIKIIHNGSISPDYMKGKDVNAVIFPFQTIYSLIYDNPGITNVFLYNAIRKRKESSRDRGSHCILLSHEAHSFSNDITNKFANRSHLCPPDCNIIKYKIIK